MLINYLYHVKEEIPKYTLYVNAILVGLIINFLVSGHPFSSIVSYIVPFFVQVFTKATYKYNNRYKDILLQLPLEREDPAFIMDSKGKILLSGGKTSELFKELGVENIFDFLQKESADELIDKLKNKKMNGFSIEVRRKITSKWYEATTKRVTKSHEDDNILVWFNEITSRKILDARISALLKFSDRTVLSLDELVKNNSILDNLSNIILTSGYEGVFIAIINEHGNLVGNVYKEVEAEILKSDPINIDKTSISPVLRSRTAANVVSGNVDDFASREEFEVEYSFNERVKSFMGTPINNFINFHEADFSIIAFNKRYKHNMYDKILFQVLLNNTRTIVTLINLAISNDEQFMQKVMGLCAAAEYSDDITGRHILRVNEYAGFISQKMGFGGEFIESISKVAALHDIGKVAMPELIKLERRYNDEERKRIEMHTIIGAKIISTMMSYSKKTDPRLNMAYKIALNHHQSWNGSGYPSLVKNNEIIEPVSIDAADYDGYKPLSGDMIPIESLIVGLADVYDALRSERPYKKKMSHDEAIKLLESDDRTGIKGEDRYGPRLWPVFKKHHEEFDRIYSKMVD